MTPADTPSAAGDPLYGNKASDLMRAAAAARPATDPAGWQPPAPETLQAMLPGYEVREFLARGGMGAVYRGEQTSLGRQVAIKILPPQLRDADPHYAERFKQEARSMAQLNHPGIVSVYDFGEMPDGTLYFIMEFIDGTDVGQMVAKQGRLSSAHAMAITAHVCDALQYAHEHGVVHRDIKPANIMVGYDGRVKVADFGLAKSVHQQNTSLTVSGHVMGTPHFVAPEALTLGMSIDHRADIYAVGVMLYQMLTGRLPQGLFEMPSMQVPGLDPRYDAIVAGAMREDREQRYQRILDMRRALDAILTQPVQKSEVAKQTMPATAVSKPAQQQLPKGQPYRAPQRSAPPPAPKKKSAAGWLAAAIVGISLTGGFLWMQRDGQPVSASVANDSKPQINAGAASEPATTTPVPAQSPAYSISPSNATREKPFTNSLGMKFVPVPGTSGLMCMHETRRQDYAEYALQVPGVPGPWKNMGFKGFPSGHEDTHPVTGVSWDDANSFCQWLSQKEGLSYRLPTDPEWSTAAGLQEKQTTQTTPEMLDGVNQDEFPWGGSQPPKNVTLAGNYVDTSYIETFKIEPKLLVGAFNLGYTDGFPTTAPVMSFRPNALGLYDLGGNVREWCADWYNATKEWRVLRGSSWQGFRREDLLSSGRAHITPRSRLDDMGFRCVLDMAPPATKPKTDTAVAPAASAPDQTGEVKLEFKNAERYFDVGGYYPSEVPMSTTPPSSITKAPAGLVAPLYGELRLGADGSQRRHPIILNNPMTAKAALFVDSNFNGDLTDDAPAKWQPGQQSNVVTGEKWDTFQGQFFVAFNRADNGDHRLARFEVSQNTGPNSTSDSLWIHPQYGRVGTVTLGGRPFDALLYDDGGKGDFSAPTSTFRLDLDGRGGFRWEEAEAFPVTESFTVDGVNYRLSGLTPGGESFRIVPSQGWTGQAAPAFSATTITGDAIQMPASYKGKLLLLHFWTTGQKSSLEELPHLKAVYEKHHSASFDMLGICVEYRSGKEKLPAFVKANAVAWPQVCEHQAGPMNHPLLKLYKNHAVPNNCLIDVDTGKVLACGLRGSALEPAISNALSAGQLRTFTDVNGRTIRAALIRVQNDDVTLKREDGQEFAIKAATLGQADIAFLKTKGLAMPNPVAATPAPPPAQPLVIPEESKTSTLQQTTIFGLSRSDASGILADARLKSNPKAVLETVQGMITGKRAILVSNLSVSAKFGTRSRVEGSYGCESEIIMNADGGLKAMLAITSLRSPGSAKLTVLDVAAKRGETHFLGSFDEDEADPKMPVRLVFVTFH